MKRLEGYKHTSWSSLYKSMTRKIDTQSCIRNVKCVSCVPFWNVCHPEACFRLAWCTVLKKCAFLKHVSDWHRANFVISRADDNMSVLTVTFEVALLLVTEKQTNKYRNAAWPSLVLHVSQIWQLSITTACKHGVIPLSHRF